MLGNHILSVGLEGMKGHEVSVEADVRDEKENFVIIGLPDASIKESKERILSCLHTLDVNTAMKKITIHLSPADKRKTGTGHDCAMLVAVLQKMLSKPLPIEGKTCFLAALSLSGNLLPFHGLIPAIQQAILLGFERIIIPQIDTSFIKNNKNFTLIPIHSVQDLIYYLKGQQQLSLPAKPFIKLMKETDKPDWIHKTDFSDIRGHKDAKRVLEIAAAGGHHVFLNGPPGCGKSMLADAFHTILPNLSDDEMLELYGIYELAKETRGLTVRPPYRHPHHSASAVSLIGGGTFPKPGEISLAHNGVLFLDELGEFARKGLDMLRQPMEEREVTISRVRQTVTYPSSFTLIAATNPCPCGYFGSSDRYCTCTPNQIRAYQLKASGPLIDRFDFILPLQSVGLNEETVSETSEMIRKRTTRARMLQNERYDYKGLNGNIPFTILMKKSMITQEQFNHIQTVCFNEKWSNRAQVKLIRIARTISDLKGETTVSWASIAEAIKWKRLALPLHQTTSERKHGQT